MTEIETEVKVEREIKKPEQKTTNAFSSRTFSSRGSDLNKFEEYKPVDLNAIYSKLEKEAKRQEENDLDAFTRLEDDQAPYTLSKTVDVQEKAAGVKINLKGKLTIFLASVSFALLSFLAIFNAVKIADLKKSISALDNEIYYNEQVINSKIGEYNALTDDSLLESKAQGQGFEEIKTENRHSVKIKKVKSNSSENEMQGENWFDKICAWVSGLFGA